MELSGTRLVLDNVHKCFKSNGITKNVLNGVSLELKSGQFTTLVGPNGSGKTTLLNICAGHVSPDIGYREIVTENHNEPNVGFVWQDYRSSLLPWLNVYENISFPLRIKGLKRNQREDIVMNLLEEYLPDVPPSKPCYELSGGQQQMVVLLRSTTIKPDIFLLDEPFSSLDQQRSWNMALFVESIWLESRPPTLFVSHDIDEAILLADRILLVTGDGKIEDSVQNDLSRPRSLEMLKSPEHLECRATLMDFLRNQYGKVNQL